MKWSVERTIRAGSAVALVILVAVGVVSYQSTLAVEAAAVLRAHSNQVRFGIQALLSELQDAETGQRGFIITGDESYLAPYNTAIAAVGGQTASLRALTADNPTQQQLLADLQPLIAAKLSEMQQTIDLRRAQGFQAAQTLVLTDQGQQTMDDIRGRLAAMLAEEDRLYQLRDAALSQQLLTVRWIIIGGGALALVTAILALGVIQGQLKNRRQAEVALAREHDLLQMLMDHIPDTIYFKDRESRFTRVNRAQASVLGLAEPAAANGKTDFDFQHEDVSRLSFTREQEIMASGQPLVDWIEYVPKPDGAPRWFSSTKVPIRDRDGQVTGLVGLSRDVTEHQQAQAALEATVQQRTQKIRQNADRAEALAHLSKALAEVSTNYREVPETVARLLSERIGDGCVLYLVSPDGQTIDTAVIHHRDPGAAAAWRDLLAANPARVDEGLSGRAMQTGQSILIPQVDREQLRATVRPDYWEFVERYAASSLLYVPLRAEGRSLGVLILSRNSADQPYNADDQAFVEDVASRAALVITNARLYADLEQRVRERTHDLEAVNKELETFSYSVSHDLRAPLRAVDGFGQILLEDYADKLDAQGLNYLQRMRTAAKDMSGLIDALITLARLTRADMRRAAVDLTDLARTTMAQLRAREPDRPADVVIVEDLSAEADPYLVRAVLENLLGNAWKFTGKTAHPRIEFGSFTQAPGDAAAGHELVFFVRDNGAGFDMAYADRLFGAFQRLHDQTEFPGSGIGLATVQRIVHRHGGRVWAEGQVGQGATFYFTLPAPATA